MLLSSIECDIIVIRKPSLLNDAEYYSVPKSNLSKVTSDFNFVDRQLNPIKSAFDLNMKLSNDEEIHIFSNGIEYSIKRDSQALRLCIGGDVPILHSHSK